MNFMYRTKKVSTLSSVYLNDTGFLNRGIVSRRSKQKVVGSAVLSAFKNLPVVLGNALDAPQCPIVAGFGNGFCENRLDEGPHIEFQSESVHFGFRMSPEEPPDEIHGI